MLEQAMPPFGSNPKFGVAIGRWILSNLKLDDPAANRDGSSFYSAWKDMLTLGDEGDYQQS